MRKTFLLKEKRRKLRRRRAEVILRSVNLGGRLIQESWMRPVNGEDRVWANLDTLKLLESRFSEEVQARLDWVIDQAEQW